MSHAPQVATDPRPIGTPDQAPAPLAARREALLRPLLPSYVLLVLYAAGCFAGYWYVSRPGYRFRQAWQALEATDYDQVRHEAARLSGTAGYKPHARLLEAAVVVRSQSYNKSSNAQSLVKKLEQAKTDPEIAPLAYLILGEVLTKSQAFPEARKVLLQAANQAPDLTQSYILLAWLSYDLGAMTDAMQALMQAAYLDRLNPRPMRLMGKIRYDQGRPTEAAEHLRESLRRSRLQPDLEDILLELADCELQNRNYGEALRLLDEEIRPLDEQFDEESPRWHLLRAKCLHATSRSDEALADLARALHREPFNVDALTLQATIAMERGDSARAKRSLLRAIDTIPGAVEARNKLRTVYQQSGHTALAQREARRITEIQKATTTIGTLLERAWKTPNDPEIRYQLGVQYREIGWQTEAFRWFNMSYSIDPTYKPALEALEAMREEYTPELATSARPAP